MLNLLNKINQWIRNILLDDVDKEPDRLPSYHKGFRSKKNPAGRIQNRFNKQQSQNKIRF